MDSDPRLHQALSELNGEAASERAAELVAKDTDAALRRLCFTVAFCPAASRDLGARVLAPYTDLLTGRMVEGVRRERHKELMPYFRVLGPEAAAPLLAMAVDGSPSERLQAVSALAWFRQAPDVQGALVQTLEHEDPQLVRVAAEILRMMMDPRGFGDKVPALPLGPFLTALQIPEARLDVVKVLGFLKNPGAIPALVKLANEGAEPEILSWLARALARLGPDDGALNCLGRLLTHLDPVVRGSAVNALAEWGTAPAVRTLVENLGLLSSHDLQHELGRLAKNEGPHVNHLQELLGHPEAALRANACRAVGFHLAQRPQTHGLPEALLACLDDESGAVRAEAARALGRAQRPEAGERLVEMLAGPEGSAAAEGLGYMAYKPALPRLCQHLLRDDRLDRSVYEAILAVSPKPQQLFLELIASAEGEVLGGAALALCETEVRGPQGALALEEALLRLRDPAELVCRALSRIGRVETLEVLHKVPGPAAERALQTLRRRLDVPRAEPVVHEQPQGIFRVHIDRTHQKLRLERDTTGLYPIDRATSRLPELLERGGMVSAAVLAHKAKCFDDGLMAAVQLARAGPLRELLLQGQELDRCAVALHLAGQPQELTASGQALCREFRVSPAAYPLGFYRWTPELSQVFACDRFLQQEIFDENEARLLAERLVGPEYATLLDFGSRLSNSPDYPGDLRCAGPPWAIIPPAGNPETDLIRRLGLRAAEVQVIDELIAQVRAGVVDLWPQAESGWYAHCLYALETLVAPDLAREAGHLELGPLYRQDLEDLFRSLLALSRETHVKDMPSCAMGLEMPPDVSVSAKLRLEPLVTYYLRRARGYSFLRAVLQEAPFDVKPLHGLREGRRNKLGLLQELEAIESLFYGCARIAAYDIGLGLSGEPGRDSAADEARAIAWLSGLESDPDLSQDVRSMVPLAEDPQGRFRVLVTFGYTWVPLEIDFARRPAVSVFDFEGNLVPASIAFKSAEERLVKPVVAELNVGRLLSREELRERFRGCATVSQMKARLEA